MSFLFNKKIISSIRILPNDKVTFKKEEEFRLFMQNTIKQRGGYYYFPNLMMRCPDNTLVLFQYDGKIRAVGILLSAKKTPCEDEQGNKYAGYYIFDVLTLHYLSNPINAQLLKSCYPDFFTFNQCKQRIPLEHLDKLCKLLEEANY